MAAARCPPVGGQQPQHLYVDLPAFPYARDDLAHLGPPRHLDVERRQRPEQRTLAIDKHNRHGPSHSEDRSNGYRGAVTGSQVGATLGFDVTEAAEIVLQIAAAYPATEVLTVSSGGRLIDAVELPGRQHLVRAPAGELTVTYTASVAGPDAVTDAVTEYDRVVALRPSRYCPSDRLGGFAARQFGSGGPGDVAEWVFQHLSYQLGSSTVTTDAIDTLLASAGVCRDYAHLTATLCRALNIPARVAAVYAPGLSPMDFHLVVEAAVDGRWRVWDATRLAPRQTLMRIATGRDAADTALATVLSGALTMTTLQIVAVAAGDLPTDDHAELVTLA
jgi:transglutaminase-like putative cysteine protease